MKAFSRLLVAAACLSSLSNAATASELVVYSSKNSSFLQPLFDDYSRETGVSIKYLVAPTAALVSRIKVEGEASQADLLLATGASHFEQAAQQGLFTAVDSSELNNNVPAHLKSADNQWFSFSKRARTILYNPDKVNAGDLKGYADLSLPKWKGKLCLRSAQAEYTQSLVAMMLQHQGEERTKAILKGWVNNLAVPPMAEDQQVVDAIEQGSCDLGIVNSYYYARLKRSNPDTRLKLFWADQDKAGVHMNVTAIALLKNAPNKTQAVDLMEWLLTKKTQSLYARISLEYPAHKKVYPVREVAKWGRFKEDQTALSYVGLNRDKAVSLLKSVNHQ